MKISDILKSVHSNLLRNKGRTFLTILAIFIGSFTIIMTTGINTGVNGYIDRQMESAGGEDSIQITPASNESAGMSGIMGSMSDKVVEYNADKNGYEAKYITADDLAEIQAVTGIKTAEVYRQITAEYITSKQTDRKFTITISQMPTDSIKVDMLAGKMVTPDASQLQLALQPDYVGELGYESDKAIIGESVTIGVKNQVTGEVKEISAVVTGVQNKSLLSMGQQTWVNKSLADKLYNIQTESLPEKYRNQSLAAIAQLDEDHLTDTQIQTVKDQLDDMGYASLTIEDSAGTIKLFFNAVTAVLTIFGVIALVAASIGIVNTLYMAVQERTREIGLMKAMGLGKSEIRLMFSLEAIALGFWGSILGVALALIVRLVANDIASGTILSGLPGFTLVEFDLWTTVAIVAVVMFIALLAGSLPARRASKLDPIDALRYE